MILNLLIDLSPHIYYVVIGNFENFPLSRMRCKMILIELLCDKYLAGINICTTKDYFKTIIKAMLKILMVVAVKAQTF